MMSGHNLYNEILAEVLLSKYIFRKILRKVCSKGSFNRINWRGEMKKILIMLMVVFGSFVYSDEAEDLIINGFNSISESVETIMRDKADEVMHEWDKNYYSIFYDNDVPVSIRRHITEIALIYAMDQIYKGNKDAIKKNKINIQELSKDFRYKVDPDGVIFWCVPKAHLAGCYVIATETLGVYGVDTGMPTIYDGFYSMYPMYMKYAGEMDVLWYRNKELAEFIYKMNGINYKIDESGHISVEL